LFNEHLTWHDLYLNIITANFFGKLTGLILLTADQAPTHWTGNPKPILGWKLLYFPIKERGTVAQRSLACRFGNKRKTHLTMCSAHPPHAMFDECQFFCQVKMHFDGNGISMTIIICHQHCPSHKMMVPLILTYDQGHTMLKRSLWFYFLLLFSDTQSHAKITCFGFYFWWVIVFVCPPGRHEGNNQHIINCTKYLCQKIDGSPSLWSKAAIVAFLASAVWCTLLKRLVEIKVEWNLWELK
jgi:hypothetical protein